MSGESTLSAYDVVVLDEVHERHLHGDFLLGIMKCIIYQKPDLKLVLMSATINIELFSNYFAKEDVKIIEVRDFKILSNTDRMYIYVILTMRFFIFI